MRLLVVRRMPRRPRECMVTMSVVPMSAHSWLSVRVLPVRVRMVMMMSWPLAVEEVEIAVKGHSRTAHLMINGLHHTLQIVALADATLPVGPPKHMVKMPLLHENTLL